ncbi:MAG: InlB B-repeat-containing protein, partial [Eubacteriales bacterium]
YKALWEANSYRITFDANGGTGGEVQTVDYRTVPIAPVVTRASYIFSGWSPTISVVTGDATYTAQWIMLGDINNNGLINAVDALKALQETAGYNLLSDIQKLIADVDKSGGINTIDAIKILQYDSGLITSF